MSILIKDAHLLGETLPDFIWGSYQYQFAAGMYFVLDGTLRNPFLSDEFMRVIRIYETYTELPVLGTYTAWTEQMAAAMRQELLESHDDEDEVELREHIKGVTTIEELLICLRECCWDLWTAIECIMHQLYPDAEHDWIDDYTGLGCWLIKNHGYVKDDECFKDFDT